ncbi:hypothetical protein CABS01_06143 [Colletotrichum abscissum]|uniref:uncharacterized protein n=1 Tax=Colletotrichum abscissum TaxID=1671311 RepID=UPI0027D4BB6A|nr:uncharacterized protein CABS01_06143 [Colletotrichum abscissum]KAK1518609.1 hypothetical protein CABS01_06143 [Colletotrichum abscissum]
MPPRRPSARLPAAKPTDVESKSAGLCYREQPSNATFESKSPHPRYCPVRYLVQNGIAASMAVIVQRLPIAVSGGEQPPMLRQLQPARNCGTSQFGRIAIVVNHTGPLMVVSVCRSRTLLTTAGYKRR